jgi:hypothetical protein
MEWSKDWTRLMRKIQAGIRRGEGRIGQDRQSQLFRGPQDGVNSLVWDWSPLFQVTHNRLPCLSLEEAICSVHVVGMSAEYSLLVWSRFTEPRQSVSQTVYHKN